jgi:hypothetical protein
MIGLSSKLLLQDLASLEQIGGDETNPAVMKRRELALLEHEIAAITEGQSVIRSNLRKM